MGDDRRSTLEATVRPGEFWLIEKSSAAELCSFDRGALSSADIVVYDRPLASLVAQVLPIGGYAEPLSRDGTARPAISPRALRFAGEGWRVAQLLETRHGDSQRLRDAVKALIQLYADDLPLAAIAKGAVESPRSWQGCLRDLPELIDDLTAADSLTVILGPLPVGFPAPTHAFAGNGLAG
jgi:hypothetical protein